MAIFTFVGIAGLSIVTNKLRNRIIFDHQALESIWTVIPALLLVVLSMPSLRLLYSVDDLYKPDRHYKTIGHQWYWRYESQVGGQDFDSYIANDEFRCLDVDTGLVADAGKLIQVITTSADVIHCWAVPRLAIKMDSIPGRLNTIVIQSLKRGPAYGQCSEICGANHSFIPIKVEFVYSY